MAAFDATNTTFGRRQHILKVLEEAGVKSKKIFIESICDSDSILEDNIRKVKLNTPDYRGVDPEKAVEDFKERRANYEKVYEPVTNSDGSYIKIINSQQYIVNSIRGYLPLKVSIIDNGWLMNVVENAWKLINLHFLQPPDCSFCHELAHFIQNLLLDASWTIRIQFAGQNWWGFGIDSSRKGICSPSSTICQGTNLSIGWQGTALSIVDFDFTKNQGNGTIYRTQQVSIHMG